MVSMPLLSNRKCPCCWDCGPTMPLTLVFPDCPSVTSTTSSRDTPLAAWVTLQDGHVPLGRNGAQWIYATPVTTNSYSGCQWQAAQYCIADDAGNRGVAWVGHLWCRDPGTGIVTRYGETKRDWNCTCEGSRFEFEMDLTGSCCCEEAPAGVTVPCCPSNTIPETLTCAMAALNGCMSLSITLQYRFFLEGGVSATHVWEGSAIEPVSGKCVYIKLVCTATFGWTIHGCCANPVGGVCTGVFPNTRTGMPCTAASPSLVFTTSCSPFTITGWFDGDFGAGTALSRCICGPAVNTRISYTIAP